MHAERAWDWLHRQAATSPHAPFLEGAGFSFTYGAFDRRVARVCGTLRRLGVGPGDRVAALLPNGLPFVELVFALIRLGAVLVPLNLRLGPSELAFQLDDAAPALLVASSERRDLVAAAGRSVPTVWVEPGGDDPLAAADPYDPPDLISPERLTAILYTSGTTGTPKGALTCLRQHFWAAVGLAQRVGHLPNDRWLLCVPLYHVSGLMILFRAVLFGAAVRVHERFAAEGVAEDLASGRVTLASLVPTMLRRVLAAWSGGFSPALRAVFLGGSFAPPGLVAAGLSRGLPVVLSYGLTETAAQAVTQSPGDAARRPKSAGRPLISCEVAVLRDGRRAAPGEEGEIAVRGPQVTSGYWRRPEATRQAFWGDWFLTGDVGYLDEEGYLTVLDRRDDLIVSGGENVYPAEVEAALLDHPSVRQAAVVAVPDPEWGQVPAAAVVLAEGEEASPGDLERHLRARLAGFKVPRAWRIVPSLPTTASGKIQRARVRALFAQGEEAQADAS